MAAELTPEYCIVRLREEASDNRDRASSHDSSGHTLEASSLRRFADEQDAIAALIERMQQALEQYADEKKWHDNDGMHVYDRVFSPDGHGYELAQRTLKGG